MFTGRNLLCAVSVSISMNRPLSPLHRAHRFALCLVFLCSHLSVLDKLFLTSCCSHRLLAFLLTSLSSCFYLVLRHTAWAIIYDIIYNNITVTLLFVFLYIIMSLHDIHLKFSLHNNIIYDDDEGDFHS